MVNKADGMNYAPEGKRSPVCGSGEFQIGVVGLDHGHIYGMCNGLTEAGAEVRLVYDRDPGKLAHFVDRYPGARAARSEMEVLENESLRMVASAIVPSQRGSLAVKALRHGKAFFSDKPPVHSREALEEIRRMVAATYQRFAVYYSERIHSEAAVRAGELVEQGAIGRVLQIVGLGPHRLNATSRPPWFWDPACNGGILTDLACHHIEQFLHFSASRRGRCLHAKVGNLHHPEHPQFQDFGDACFLGDTGASLYLRVDWFTPDGLSVWGDGRTFIVGTEGSIELRKYVDVGRSDGGDHIYLVDRTGEHHFQVAGQVGFPYFGQLIRDCLDGTELAMSHDRIFHVMELSLDAQACALVMDGGVAALPAVMG